MTVVLWTLPGSASLAVHLVLEETGRPYTLRRVQVDADGNREPALLALSPDGRVPVLELDGQVLTESAALCLLLAERDPERRLLPPAGSADHAETLRTMIFLTNTLQETLLRSLYAARYVDDPMAAPAVQRAAEARLATLFGRLDERLRAHDHVVGDAFTVADLYLFMLTRWGRRLSSPAWLLPGVRAHWLRVAERPAVAHVLADQGLDERPPA